ncbi:hypothetical protein ON010_g4867 [Phytophthora cinnamomi]|nr:hypothetical protein ON010_g4867 [Phytophthora cinnamomi]
MWASHRQLIVEIQSESNSGRDELRTTYESVLVENRQGSRIVSGSGNIPDDAVLAEADKAVVLTFNAATVGTSASTSAGPSTPVLLAVAAACVAAIGAVAVIKKRAENALSTPHHTHERYSLLPSRASREARTFQSDRQLTPPDELDSDTFEATLRFVEECAIETFGEISELTPSVTTLLSPSSELLPFDVASLVDESDQLPTETLATIPLPIPDATVTTDSRTTTRKRKSSRPRKPQANPNRARDEMKFELAYLREKRTRLLLFVERMSRQW